MKRSRTRKRKWKWREVDKFKMRFVVRMDGVKNGLGSVDWGQEAHRGARGDFYAGA